MDEPASPPVPIRPLTTKQERRLVDHLEERFLETTRQFKKRSDPSSTLRTLAAYVQTTRTLLSLILQIPPLDPSTPLRTSFLLRFTNDVVNAIPGYPAEAETLPALLEWLDMLDRGWLAVLRQQSWDTARNEGVELVLPAEAGMKSSPPNMTDRTRLRSLLVTGTERLETWLEALNTETEDYGEVLTRLGLQQAFDELFSRTLGEMGAFGGTEVHMTDLVDVADLVDEDEGID
ncbi:hypothetical protein OF83DRAFT_1165022 [Amylostereum chailletii]|nr:hypothetical protein OF83DRAFT_1165022 [Amylostereum chailletii]